MIMTVLDLTAIKIFCIVPLVRTQAKLRYKETPK